MQQAGRLVPLQVPWMLSPSVPEIRLTVVEDGDAIAMFDAAVLPESEDASFAALVSRRVEMRFKAGQWVRTSPSFADADIIPPGLFDRSALDALLGDPADAEWVVSFRRRWVADGICPDPRAYEIQGSRWLVESGALRFGCQHYVLTGHDIWLEVLCLGLTWQWAGEASADAIDTSWITQLRHGPSD
jgi:hypothetical protein